MKHEGKLTSSLLYKLHLRAGRHHSCGVQKEKRWKDNKVPKRSFFRPPLPVNEAAVPVIRRAQVRLPGHIVAGEEVLLWCSANARVRGSRSELRMV